ncbi:hypothetical protein [Streptomyces sp. NPDC047869]|uniref:hypothetical protein n=1 Tax=Streptomyces sp. NPDC047869 TaxID=3154709 RepID=UPI003451DEE3
MREDAAADGGGDHAALGHHHRDRDAEPERLAAVAAYDRAGAPLRLLLPGAPVLAAFRAATRAWRARTIPLSSVLT